MSERIDAINLWELETRARELLPQMAYDYYASGANDEITLRESGMELTQLALRRFYAFLSYRVLGTSDRNSVSAVKTQTTYLEFFFRNRRILRFLLP